MLFKDLYKCFYSIEVKDCPSELKSLTTRGTAIRKPSAFQSTLKVILGSFNPPSTQVWNTGVEDIDRTFASFYMHPNGSPANH